MDNKTVNKFNNVTCYLTSSTGNITVDAPFAGLPQYDINIAPTGIEPGLYNPVSLLVSETGQIRAINQGTPKGTQIKTGSLKIQTTPGEIILDLPDGVPLSISSGTLDVVPNTTTGGYAIDLLPDAVTSVTSTNHDLVSGNIVDNELTLSPNVGLVTGIKSTNNLVTCAKDTNTPSVIDITASTNIITSVTSSDTGVINVTTSTDQATGGTAVVISPGASAIEDITTSNSNLLGVSTNANTVTLTPNANLVTSVTSGASDLTATIANNTLTLGLGSKLVTSVTSANPAITAAITNNTLTLAPSGSVVTSVTSSNSALTASIANNLLTLGLTLPASASITAAAYTISPGSSALRGTETFTNSAISPTSVICITPVSAAVTAGQWGQTIMLTILNQKAGSVTFSWITFQGSIGTQNLTFNILIAN